MKYLSLQLKGYIRLVNGIGTPDIFIDFRRQKFRTCIIRGENGSGKSTIFNALSVLPDSNDSFIPGKPAMKEIYLQDGNTIYIITCVHNVKNNGDRDTTKVYFKKQFPDGRVVELNENGNVNSYKDVLFEELKLDSNFIALSQLSMDDKGLATKRPAERKRFVNSIISSLEVYNNMYKTLNKHSSVYKSMVNSVASKLGQLGDENILKSNFSALSSRITQLSAQKDQYMQKMGEFKFQVDSVDKDGTLQSTLAEKTEEYNELVERSKTLYKSIDYLYNKGNIDRDNTDVQEALEFAKTSLNKVSVENELYNGEITSLRSKREEVSKKIVEKKLFIQQTNAEAEDPKSLEDKINDYKEKMQGIIDAFHSIGIDDISNISRDEYVLALNTIKNIQDSIEVTKSTTTIDIFTEAIGIAVGDIDYSISVDTVKNQKESIEALIRSREKLIIELNEKSKILNVLDMRPKSCKVDDCPFISEALSYRNNRISDQLDDANREYEELQKKQKEIEASYQHQLDLRSVVNAISNIIRDIKIHQAVLMKLPNGIICSNPKELFIRYLNNNEVYQDIMSIYQYIDYANNIDIYKQYQILVMDLTNKLNVALTRSTIVEAVNKEIEEYNASIVSIDESIKEKNIKISNNNLIIMDLNNQIDILTRLSTLINDRETIKTQMTSAKAIVDEISSKLKSVESSMIGINNLRDMIASCETEISNASRELDQISYSLKLYKEYQEEYNQLSENYDYIETIKYYASPTTGIQLVFMEMYMSKIISLANELLALLFGGRFMIQQFIINESEFRIPCLTDNYTIDDISSMSSAQVSMISMILSFSLLYHSSTKYNIIKLDEIDAPLDENNRLMFIDVLNEIMNIMHTEQCIMISHNSELQLDTSDVIVLKSNNLSSDYTKGNIIWDYNNGGK